MPDETPDLNKHERVEPVTLTPDEARRGKYVSKERFDEVLADLRSSMSDLATARSQLTVAETGRRTAEETLTTTKATLERDLDAARQQAAWADSVGTLAGAGLTDARAQRYIRRDFEDREVGADGKKPDWQTWWAANAAEYETTFGAVKQPPATPPTPPAATKDKPPPPKTREDRNAGKPNAGQFSEEAILNMSAEDWKANKDTIIRGVLGPPPVDA